MATKNGLIARPSQALCGQAPAPGDKSISHRALIFGALAQGGSRVSGLLESDDVFRTAAAMRALGAEVERDGEDWLITGASWSNPTKPLYFGNSGTGARLVMGAVAGAGVGATFEGDASLRARPMGRVLEPLRMMGLTAEDRDGRLPVRLDAHNGLESIHCKLATPSAQVKSAIALAALGAEGVTRIHEPMLCRDHTERMLGAFGVNVETQGDGEAGRFIQIEGGQTLRATEITTPGDPSSAAFIVAAALITPYAEVTITNVLVNPLRTGFYEIAREMGADIVFENQHMAGGEPVADITARHSVLHGVEVPAMRAPSMIDEYPILSVLAAFCHGETKMLGLEELRVKESDRIAAVEAGLTACGVDAASGDDWLRIIGGGAPTGGAKVKTYHDHRIAMSFAVMGGAAQQAIEIDDASMIATSYPRFIDTMRALGADLSLK